MKTKEKQVEQAAYKRHEGDPSAISGFLDGAAWERKRIIQLIKELDTALYEIPLCDVIKEIKKQK